MVREIVKQTEGSGSFVLAGARQSWAGGPTLTFFEAEAMKKKKKQEKKCIYS